MFLLLRRADIPNGSLQIDDIRSPSEHSNQGPRIQGPIYLRQPDNERTFTAVGSSASERVYRTAFSGLAAYVQDNFSDPAGAMITDGDAMDAALALINRVRMGWALDWDSIEVTLTGVLGGGPKDTSMGDAGPTFFPSEIMRILGGETYTVPAGSVLQNQFGNWLYIRRGSFVRQTGIGSSDPIDYYDAYYAAGGFIFNESGFKASQAGGKVAGFSSPSFTYLGVSGPAITVYNDNGTLA